MEQTANSPHTDSTSVEAFSPLPITAFEREVNLTTTAEKEIKYTIRAYPNEKLNVVLDHPPLHGNIEFHNERTFIYQPDDYFKGIDTFSCLLQNKLGHVLAIPFTITVNPAKKKEERVVKVKHTPLPSVFKFKTSIGKKLIKDIPLREESEDPYTLSLMRPTANGEVEVYPDGTFEYTPSPQFVGSDSFVVLQKFVKRPTEKITIEILVVKPVMKRQLPNKVKAPVKPLKKNSKKL